MPPGRFDRDAMSLVARRELLGAFAALSCRPADALEAVVPTLLREERTLFGSPCEVALSATPPADARAALAEAWRDLEEINRRWNAWKPGELTALNAAFRAGRAAPASPLLRAMVLRARDLEQASGGLFNPGIGGLVGAWGFHADVLRDDPAPSAAQRRHWLAARPSLAQIEVRGALMRSSNPGLQLDFGAYAKGVAIDLVLDRLQASDCAAALVNLGGNLAVMGQVGARPWRIGIRDPFGRGVVATLDTAGREAVVTSGSYERHRLADGQRVTHIIDPDRAAPAPDVISVTVVHPSAGHADAAATALLVAGRSRWQRVARRLGVDQVLLIDRHGAAEVMPRLAQRLAVADPEWRRRIRPA